MVIPSMSSATASIGTRRTTPGPRRSTRRKRQTSVVVEPPTPGDGQLHHDLVSSRKRRSDKCSENADRVLLDRRESIARGDESRHVRSEATSTSGQQACEDSVGCEQESTHRTRCPHGRDRSGTSSPQEGRDTATRRGRDHPSGTRGSDGKNDHSIDRSPRRSRGTTRRSAPSGGWRRPLMGREPIGPRPTTWSRRGASGRAPTRRHTSSCSRLGCAMRSGYENRVVQRER